MEDEWRNEKIKWQSMIHHPTLWSQIKGKEEDRFTENTRFTKNKTQKMNINDNT